jgi:hypothetical protein
MLPTHFWSNPRGENLPGTEPADGGAPGSSLETLEQQVLLPDRVDRAVLVHHRAMFAPATVFVYLASPLCSALNNWTIERWLSRDKRLHGVIVANTQLPEDGAKEIRRIGGHPQIAGVLLAASPSGKFFGHPSYLPILEAATEHDLPLIIHSGIDGVYETPGARPAGGTPYTFAEYTVISPLALITQMTNMITTGVFERFPSLRVYLAGGGFGWVPGALRRADVSWRDFRFEVPWVKKAPHEYFAEHFRVSTYGLERGDDLPYGLEFFERYPEMRDVIIYGSGYPAWDTSRVADVEGAVPNDWLPQVLYENADRFFRWHPSSPSPPQTKGDVSQTPAGLP